MRPPKPPRSPWNIEVLPQKWCDVPGCSEIAAGIIHWPPIPPYNACRKHVEESRQAFLAASLQEVTE